MSEFFKSITPYGHEQVMFCYDKETGLKAIIAVHDTTMGPALGGTRIWDYKSDDDALYDVLRLSQGMTYKNAAANLKLGGGKGVIIGDAKKIKNAELFRIYGRLVETFKGKYITAEDVNTTVEDMEYVHEETEHVAGLKESSGDPSPYTALGVYNGIKSAFKYKYGVDTLKDVRIAVQGTGKVGYGVCELLHNEGAKLIVADINKDNVEKAINILGATEAKGNIIEQECDIFAPCALGAVLSVENIPKLKCSIVAGAANNVLVDDDAGKLIHDSGILYVPDFIINAGGVISVYYGLNGKFSHDKAVAKVEEIFNSVQNILDISKKDDLPTSKAAVNYAKQIIEENKKVKI
eukprot:TRINITY_DN44_c0_g1_i8.p1 TRINITY_DN44_c0_g1~~TRINITY_DN44_c0_g1_i8.p1  ORF type:complete len:350 (+),score=-38.63 TRINITY_DN44_c0_g1_i8:193-1242(+)